MPTSGNAFRRWEQKCLGGGAGGKQRAVVYPTFCFKFRSHVYAGKKKKSKNYYHLNLVNFNLSPWTLVWLSCLFSHKVQALRINRFMCLPWWREINRDSRKGSISVFNRSSRVCTCVCVCVCVCWKEESPKVLTIEPLKTLPVWRTVKTMSLTTSHT